MKIVYIGSNSTFSLTPFLTLMKSKHQLCALAYDDVHSDFNVIQKNSIQSYALNNAIPLIKIDSDYSNTILKLKLYQPDIILISCYSRLIPQSVVSIAKKGCFNLHPSILPRFRGPVPLFWQYREGVESFGVTLHRVSEGFDDGNIISQKVIVLDDGLSKNKAMELLATNSCDFILDTLTDIENDNVNEVEQVKKNSSYQSYPNESDYIVSVLWTAKRIYNFISAYKKDGVIFFCELDNVQYRLIDVFSYQDMSYSEHAKNSVGEGGCILECLDSYLLCKVKID